MPSRGLASVVAAFAASGACTQPSEGPSGPSGPLAEPELIAAAILDSFEMPKGISEAPGGDLYYLADVQEQSVIAGRQLGRSGSVIARLAPDGTVRWARTVVGAAI